MTLVTKFLKEHGLRVTAIRKDVFNYLSKINRAVSHSELEVVFSSDYDRATVYRTLQSFLEKGIIHKIPNDSGAAKYALCHSECSHEHHYDNHVHFKCNKCEDLVCLHEVEVPEVKLPSNFSAKNKILLIEGVCANCN